MIMLKGIKPEDNIITNGENFYDQPINSDVKRYKELRKLVAEQSEDYTVWCLLDYNYIKNHYRLFAVDFGRQKVLDPDPKAIPQVKFVGQFKKLYNNGNVTDSGDERSTFVLTTLEKINETRLNFFQGRVTNLEKMGNYVERGFLQEIQCKE